MFTGIIEFKAAVLKKGKDFIEVEKKWDDLAIGESISVNGVCLTLVKSDRNSMRFDVSQKTFEITNLKFLKKGDIVNLERALKIGDRLGGHFVYGHVDCVGTVLRKYKEGSFLYLWIKIPLSEKKYVFKSASVSVEGISLTVQEVKGNEVLFVLIPETVERTNIGLKKIGNKVNIEWDMLIKKEKSSK